MTAADRALEQRIEAARLNLLEAQTEQAQRAAWTLMKALLCQRTPERILQMEREQGLRPPWAT